MLSGRFVAVASVLFIAGTVVSGCGSPKDVPVEVQLAAPADSFFARVEKVHLALRGTPEQAAQVEIVAQRVEQQDYSECMRGAGFQYDVPVVNWILPQLRRYEPSWWARPSMAVAGLGMGYAEPFRPDPASTESEQATSYDSLTEDRKHAYDAALDACVKEAASRSGDAKAQQDAARALEGSFRKAMNQATDAGDFTSITMSYETCMAEAGFPASGPGRLYSVAENAVVQTGLWDLDPRSVEYAELQPMAQQVEVKIGQADVGCRAPLSDQVVELLTPVLDSWWADNGARVEVVGKGWTTLGQ